MAEQAYEPLRAALERGVTFSAGCEFLLPRILGVAALQLGRESDAESHLRKAIARAREIGAAPGHARSCLDLAGLLLGRGARGDHDEARRLLLLAEERFVALGMLPLLAESDRLRAELGLPARETGEQPAASPPSAPLSWREDQVLRALSRDLSDADLGELLLLRDATVRRIRGRISEKVGVQGSTGAAAYAYAHAPEVVPAEGPRRQSAGGGGRRVLWVSDIEGSTVLLEKLGDARAQTFFQLHDRLVRRHVRSHAGQEIQHTGDGLIAAFADARLALLCAAEVQRELAAHNAKRSGPPLRVRIGIHAGHAVPAEDRLFGIAVHTTFRVCDEAKGGEIVASRAVVEGFRELGLEDLGETSLRDVKLPLRLFRVQWDEDAPTES